MVSPTEPTSWWEVLKIWSPGLWPSFLLLPESRTQETTHWFCWGLTNSPVHLFPPMEIPWPTWQAHLYGRLDLVKTLFFSGLQSKLIFFHGLQHMGQSSLLRCQMDYPQIKETSRNWISLWKKKQYAQFVLSLFLRESPDTSLTSDPVRCFIKVTGL